MARPWPVKPSPWFLPAGHDDLNLSTNEDGQVSIDAPVTGVVMISAIWITLPDQPDGVYHSDYATLTIDLPSAP